MSCQAENFEQQKKIRKRKKSNLPVAPPGCHTHGAVGFSVIAEMRKG